MKNDKILGVIILSRLCSTAKRSERATVKNRAVNGDFNFLFHIRVGPRPDRKPRTGQPQAALELRTAMRSNLNIFLRLASEFIKIDRYLWSKN